MERAHHVDVESQPEGLVGQLREHRRRRDAGVVDQDVQRSAAEAGGLRGGSVGGRAVADVQRARVGLAAVRADAFGHCGSRLGVDVGDEHRGACFSERGCNRRTDSAARAGPGDHGGTAGQIEIPHQ